MIDTERISSLDTGGVLALAAAAYRSRVEAEAAVFVAAAHYADIHDVDLLGATAAMFAGCERGRRLGGVGTPRVAEFAPAEFGAVQQLGTVAAAHLIADALDCRHRLPRVWARVLDGSVRVWKAREVAAATRH